MAWSSAKSRVAFVGAAAMVTFYCAMVLNDLMRSPLQYHQSLRGSGIPFAGIGIVAFLSSRWFAAFAKRQAGNSRFAFIRVFWEYTSEKDIRFFCAYMGLAFFALGVSIFSLL